MVVFYHKSELESFVQRNREMGKKIGFAPTMGALHLGHMSLYTKSANENDITIASIFINPTQFNNMEDLQKYPKTIEKDIILLQNSQNVHAVYIPDICDVYPHEVRSDPYSFDGLDQEMEGRSRPGHFNGVATIVHTLFQQVKPHNAYFGEKDFQQLAIIRKMVEITKFPVKISGVPTLREANGLAMSSRNLRLTEQERNKAGLIYSTLLRVQDWFRIISIPEIENRVKDIFEEQENMHLEYFIIAEEATLKKTDFFYQDKNYRAFIVVVINNVRLIDNIALS